jgi:hypothetical protein
VPSTAVAVPTVVGEACAGLPEQLTGLEAGGGGLTIAVAVITVAGGARDAEHRTAEQCRGCGDRAGASTALEQVC